jgi:hypothetical protein
MCVCACVHALRACVCALCMIVQYVQSTNSTRKDWQSFLQFPCKIIFALGSRITHSKAQGRENSCQTIKVSDNYIM